MTRSPSRWTFSSCRWRNRATPTQLKQSSPEAASSARSAPQANFNDAMLRLHRFHIRISDMKTIAISIDEPTLGALDRLAQKERFRRKRSELVREALVEFLARRQILEQEAIERAAISKHRSLLARQAKAMVAEQAKR